MTEPQPHDGISAYFDGELSPSECEAIARQLSQSAAAQTELAEIRQLSEALRRLPRDAAPSDLHSRVMSRTSRETAKAHRAVSSSGAMIFWGKWLAAAAALVVLVSWWPSFWKPNPSDSPSIAARSSQPMIGPDEEAPLSSVDTPGDRAEQAAGPLRVHLGSEGEMLAQDQNPPPPQAQGNSPRFGAAESVPGPSAVAPFEAQMRPDAAAGFANSNSPIAGALPPDPQVERVFDFANRQTDGVVIVEITAEDRLKTQAQLQKLLAQNSVLPANSSVSPDQPPSDGGRDRTEEESDLTLYVQSSREQLSIALTQLRQQSSTRIQPQSARALNNIPVLENENVSPGGQRGQTRFRRSLAWSIERYQNQRAGQDGARTNDERNRRQLNTGDAKPPAPGIAAAEMGAFQRPVEMPNSPKDSFQMLVQTPAGALSKPSRDEAESPPRESNPERVVPLEKKVQAPATAEAGFDRQPVGAKPVRLMFIFRERSPQPAK